MKPRPFKLGDKVICNTHSYSTYGEEGEIIMIDEYGCDVAFPRGETELVLFHFLDEIKSKRPELKLIMGDRL